MSRFARFICDTFAADSMSSVAAIDQEHQWMSSKAHNSNHLKTQVPNCTVAMTKHVIEKGCTYVNMTQSQAWFSCFYCVCRATTKRLAELAVMVSHLTVFCTTQLETYPEYTRCCEGALGAVLNRHASKRGWNCLTRYSNAWQVSSSCNQEVFNSLQACSFVAGVIAYVLVGSRAISYVYK